MPSTAHESIMFKDLLGSDKMREIFSDNSTISAYLEVERALAVVQARLGLIPQGAADAIVEHAHLTNIDLIRYENRTAVIGAPILPVVEEIVAAVPDGLGEWAHYGTTTQDIMDTGLVLQIRRAFDVIEHDLASISKTLADHARTYRDTPIAGRSHRQHALPVTFGFKVAVWLSGVERQRKRLTEIRPRVLVGQFGGAAGTLASLVEHGFAIQEGLMKELSLGVPDATWHTMRDTLTEAVTFLGLMTGTLAKIGCDISLMMQTEVAEVSEPFLPGRGSSSTMPQKRNPVGTEMMMVAAETVRADAHMMLGGMVQDHERASGTYKFELIALPRAFIAASAALKHAIDILPGLEVDTERMRRNLDATHGLIVSEAVMMGLAPAIGRQTAHDIVYDACRAAIAKNTTLLEVLRSMSEITKHVSDDELAAMCEPANYVGLAGEMVDRVLAALD
jgi:3-carboxy-cis,cis-muconate cycloisomerase